MSSIEETKKRLAAEVAKNEELLAKAKRALEKLEKVQNIEEPPPGTVLRFSRSLAGNSGQKYTFVAFRAAPHQESWYVVGKKTTLQNLLGLTDGANTWEQMLLAIGDAKVRFATEWSLRPANQFDYFRGTDSGRIFRAPLGDTTSSRRAEVWSHNSQGWLLTLATSPRHLRTNPNIWAPISVEQAREAIG